MINPIINFVIYESLKKHAIRNYFDGNEKSLSKSAIFLMSSAGKIAATFATYPILTHRVR